jgi:hypothetical protein
MAPHAKRPRANEDADSTGTKGDDLATTVNLLLQVDPTKLGLEAMAVEDDTVFNQLVQRIECLVKELETAKEARLILKDTKPAATSTSRRKSQKVKPVTETAPRRRSPRLLEKSALAIPTEVLRQIKCSDFLATEELGRFLLLVSKSITKDLGGNEPVWYDICRSRWKNSLLVPKSLIQARGYQWLFQQRYQRLAMRLTSPLKALSPPSLQPENLQLLISIHVGPKEISSEILSGEALHQLLQTGEVDWSLAIPIKLQDQLVSKKRLQKPRTTDFHKWVATIHAIRLDTNRCCLLHQSTCRAWWNWSQETGVGGSEGDDNTSDLRWRQARPASDTAAATASSSSSEDVIDGATPKGCVGFRANQLGLELSERGKALEHRIRQEEVVDRFDEADTFQGIVVEPTILCVEPDGGSVQDRQFTKIKLRAKRFFKSGYCCVFNSTGVSANNGVTFLHLLEELYGWEESPSLIQKLRFKVGSKVLCRMGPNPNEDWSEGTIVQLWYRESKWPSGSYAPYKIRLDEGQYIFAPSDEDRVIRRPT